MQAVATQEKTFTLGTNLTLISREYGYEVRERKLSSTHISRLYYKAALRRAWNETTSKTNKKAREQAAGCCILPQCKEETALLLTALFARVIVSDPTACYYSPETGRLSIYAGSPDAWGFEDTTRRIMRLPELLMTYTDPLPLTADGFEDQQREQVSAQVKAELAEAQIYPNQSGSSTTLPHLKPILYLGIGDVLVMFPVADIGKPEWRNLWPDGEPVPGAAEFVQWAHKHFEVRWLDTTCLYGELLEQQARKLAQLLRIDYNLLKGIRNPKQAWMYSLVQGIDVETEREWIWVGADLIADERRDLQKGNIKERFIETDCAASPDALLKTWHLLRQKFNLN